MKSLLLLIVSALICGFSFTQIDKSYTFDKEKLLKESEALYLPKKEAIEAISLGYRNFVGHIIWFNTISYFGKHYKSDGHYTWLYHMCELVTSLNPRALHVYNFCSTMLSWEADSAAKSIQLLTKGIKEKPESWELYYLRGFNYMYFFKDSLLAQQDFQKGASLPGAPHFLANLASKKLALLEKPEEAIEFLSNMLKNSNDPMQKSALRFRLEQVVDDLNIKNLETAAKIYKQKNSYFPKKLEILVSEKILQNLTTDPWGENYNIDPTTGKVSSNSKNTRLRKR
ncbi:MAG: hypothetical protein KDD56_03090 [Bdellovibrionales bacterium]|nr:hypothetical protein [Bdellovibrionales bacterium]